MGARSARVALRLLCAAGLAAAVGRLVSPTLHAQVFGNVQIGGGGYVTSVVGCPTEKNLFYAKTDVGGAFRWIESTKSWKPLLDWVSTGETTYMGVESLAVDPSSPNKLYLLAGTSYWNGGKTAILRSSNYGETFAVTDVTALFKASGNGSDREKGETLAVDPNAGGILFCGTRYNQGLFRSSDSGVTWKHVDSLNVTDASISFVVFDPSSGTPCNRIYVGVRRTGTNLFATNDGGTSWTAVASSPSNALPQRCAYATNAAGKAFLYVTYGDGSNGAVMKYSPSDNTWVNCSPAGARTYSGIGVCASSPDLVVATSFENWLSQPWGWGDRIYVSANGGASWTDLIASSRVTMDANGFPWIQNHAIHWASCATIDPFNPNRVFVTSGNGLFCTENLNTGASASTWKFMVKGLEETVPLDFMSVPGGPLISSVGDQGGFVHADIFTPPSGTISQSSGMAYAGKKPTFLARVAGDLYYADGDPTQWTKVATNPGGLSGGHVAVTADGGAMLWHASVNGAYQCWRTSDRGVSWSASTGIGFACAPLGDPADATRVYAYNKADGGLYVSEDSGRSFARKGLAGTGGNARFAVAPGVAGHIWVSLYGGGLARSTDAGATFSKLSVYSCDAVALGKAAPGASYPAVYLWGRPSSTSVVGLYRSDDSGASWRRINDDAHEYGGLGNAGMIAADMNDYGRVYMSTVGRGIICIDSPLPDGTYRLVARHSGKALDAAGGGTADGTSLIQWPYSGANNQRWTVAYRGNNQYSIVGLASGKAVDVESYSTANGAKVQLWTYYGQTNQKYTFTPVGGRYRISPAHAPGSCLEVAGASTADGAPVQLWNYLGGTNQQWDLRTP